MAGCQVHAVTKGVVTAKPQLVAASWEFCVCVTALPSVLKHVQTFYATSPKSFDGNWLVILTLSGLNITPSG